MTNILPLKPRQSLDARDTFDAKRQEWKSQPLEQEPCYYPLWWKCVALMGVVWLILLAGIYWGFHS